MRRPAPLLTFANAKTVKGEPLGYLTAIMYLTPWTTLRGYNVCPFATRGCTSSCLYTAGMGQFDYVRRARERRTLAYLENPKLVLPTTRRTPSIGLIS